MMKAKYSAVDALKEHLLSGHRITAFEANALFGVQSPTREISQLRKQGFLVKKQSVPFARVVRRINEFCTFSPPTNLPVMELRATEWWIQID